MLLRSKRSLPGRLGWRGHLIQRRRGRETKKQRDEEAKRRQSTETQKHRDEEAKRQRRTETKKQGDEGADRSAEDLLRSKRSLPGRLGWRGHLIQRRRGRETKKQRDEEAKRRQSTETQKHRDEEAKRQRRTETKKQGDEGADRSAENPAVGRPRLRGGGYGGSFGAWEAVTRSHIIPCKVASPRCMLKSFPMFTPHRRMFSTHMRNTHMLPIPNSEAAALLFVSDSAA